MGEIESDQLIGALQMLVKVRRAVCADVVTHVFTPRCHHARTLSSRTFPASPPVEREGSRAARRRTVRRSAAQVFRVRLAGESHVHLR
jgi:hypothetical protein